MLEKLADFIGKLQKKPHYVRLQIMWGGVAFCMLFVLSFWFWSLNNLVMSQKDQGSTDDKQIIQGLTQIKKDVPTLWGSLGAGIGNVVESIKESSGDGSSTGSTPSPALPADKLPIE